ncbi:hypothetical protein [Rhizobium sp. PL01]|uniref:hypothetical protein n=1 Tax=Rhizobium sp. PL01 TaxID=3085631 RepID=UPI0029815F82|nr:hypothetical protein [Rhizobium sp. PL01]MDW5314131.1 hypothetical protein [Rhizobium sp. PL01]
MNHLLLMGAGFCGDADMIACIGRNCVMGRDLFMMTHGIATKILHLRKRRRPAADQGAKDGKGEDGDTHEAHIGTVDVEEKAGGADLFKVAARSALHV